MCSGKPNDRTTKNGNPFDNKLDPATNLTIALFIVFMYDVGIPYTVLTC